MISQNQQILSYQIMKTQASFILLVKIYLKSLGELIHLVDIMTHVDQKKGQISYRNEAGIPNTNDREEESIAIVDIFARRSESPHNVVMLD
eukprot:CAMPEP_0197833812 /NCGR_PEP_ID=MMETSP1437-20131217/20195_1 /TAXON_ID=49252 ORGANISM="Eucampia antarctica, Strain CCMP1452" /NCGR_SAMPLE_ID=MMETSP1437 /ASSEMBLY_ACC=CAM_ASM_001096 /LENGTH=90 /DNA_ID=CAMNT_0043438085 /DNA_START=39 /DNA_END=311 /DNA_ORIENTATION=-